MAREKRSSGFYFLAAVFALYVLFLYGPVIVIGVLSFQGPEGGLTFPMRGFSTYWFQQLFAGASIGDVSGAFGRSIKLGLVVMAVTTVLSLMAGLGFRSRFRGASAMFYIAIASLIVPSVVISLGISAMFQLLGWDRSWITSALGAHLTWTLPFGLLIMFAAFNRFNKSHEEAARGLGAKGFRVLWEVVIPIVAPSLLGVALFGFTLSYDELARTSQASGALNTLPLELQAMQTNATTPVIYALGTLTTLLSFTVIALALSLAAFLKRRRARHGSDAAKAG
jgi:putative spermidine/putrescine transport system permease protein